MITDLKSGIRRTGPVTAVGVAASVLLFRIPNFASQLGTKTFVVRKLFVRNNAAGNLPFTLGTGAAGAYVAATPNFLALNNIENIWTEVELPNVEFAADLYIQAPTWAAGTLDAQVEVEERG